MKKNWILLSLAAWLIASPAASENYSIRGDQSSQIDFQILQKIETMPGTSRLLLSFVAPASFTSPTYSQKIKNVDFNFDPPPVQRTERTDHHGHKIIQAIWRNPNGPIKSVVKFQADNRVSLQSLKSHARFPIPPENQPDKTFLKATPLVASDHEDIRSKAEQLTRFSTTLFDAIQQILTWLVDHMHYEANPSDYGALYAFQNGSGNCQNYSHLAAALLRSIKIPVRIVNGLTHSKSYDIDMGETILTSRMALGRHAWIEVYFPDLGWIPFDPSGTEMFVSNRFIRMVIGIDNDETKQDGLIQWVSEPGISGWPQYQETIEAEFISDHIQLLAEKENYGPRKLLLCPNVESVFAKVSAQTPAAVPETSELPGPVLEIKEPSYTRPFEFGNLEFPRHVDFLSARETAQPGKSGAMELRKNFMVETAEYVTTQGRQYAQIFILDRPLQLQSIALALYKFGGEGQIWLDLFEDEGDKPGNYIATSDIWDLDQIDYAPGYDWIDFSFEKAPMHLPPGRYWAALGFAGSPIINWFFSFGKPVGPLDGTRYKTIFDSDWSRSLVFEFNYRVKGLAAE